MNIDLFGQLDTDWHRWTERPCADQTLRRWQTMTPALRPVKTFEEMLASFEDRAACEVHDRMLLALLDLARRDQDATRVVLRILRSGLVSLATRARRWQDWEDACSTILLAALAQIPRYPMHRTSRVAANLLGDIWHTVWIERQSALLREADWQHCVDTDDMDEIEDTSEPRRGDELTSLIDEAVRRRRISSYDARLVTLHRVYGYTNVEVGRIEGLQPCTIRKRRVAAEAAITALAVA